MSISYKSSSVLTPQHPGMQKPPSQCGKVLPILQVRALGHWTQKHHQHHDLTIKPSVKMNKEKTWPGKKSRNDTPLWHSHGITSHGVIKDSTREFKDPCRGISACLDPFCKLLGPSQACRVSCCSMLQINGKSYFTYTVSEGHYLILTVWICCCETTRITR